jgi:hypothetical protein
MSLAWLWTLLAFTVLGLMSMGVQQSLPELPPLPAQAAEGPATPEPAVVLPFDDALEASPYAVGLERGQATDALPALRRVETTRGTELVCELAAPSNHLGQLDGKAIARGLAAQLSASGIFDGGVKAIDNAQDVHGQTVVIWGKIKEATLRILKDGKREYDIEVDFSAARVYGAGASLPEPFWHESLRRESQAEGGAPALFEVSALLGGLYDDAAKKLGGKLKGDGAAAAADDGPAQVLDSAPDAPAADAAPASE